MRSYLSLEQGFTFVGGDYSTHYLGNYRAHRVLRPDQKATWASFYPSPKDAPSELLYPWDLTNKNYFNNQEQQNRESKQRLKNLTNI